MRTLARTGKPASLDNLHRLLQCLDVESLQHFTVNSVSIVIAFVPGHSTRSSRLEFSSRKLAVEILSQKRMDQPELKLTIDEKGN